jgi:hypothetical protein
MSSSAHAQLEKVLDLLAKAELAVAAYYAACVPVGGVFGLLCDELRAAELQHASYLRTLKRRVKTHPEKIHPGRHFSEQVVEDFIRRVHQGREQVRSRQLSRVEMLSLALELEDALLENRPWEAVRSHDPQVTPMLRQLEDETQAHRQRLQDQLGRARDAA